MEISISSARVEKANLQTIRETRLNICSRSEVVRGRGEEVGGNRARFQFYRASYEIPGAISEGESNESWSVPAVGEGGRGDSPYE